MHSSVDRHLSCYLLLTIVNSAAVNVGGGGMCLFELEFSSFLDICPGMRLLDHMLALVLVF